MMLHLGMGQEWGEERKGKKNCSEFINYDHFLISPHHFTSLLEDQLCYDFLSKFILILLLGPFVTLYTLEL